MFQLVSDLVSHALERLKLLELFELLFPMPAECLLPLALRLSIFF
jgi:hypothetical protein